MSSYDEQTKFWQAVLDGAKRIDEEKRKEEGRVAAMVQALNAKMEQLIKKDTDDGLG